MRYNEKNLVHRQENKLKNRTRELIGSTYGMPLSCIQFLEDVNVLFHNPRSTSSHSITIDPLTSYRNIDSGIRHGLICFYILLDNGEKNAKDTSLNVLISEQGLQYELFAGSGIILCSKLKHEVSLSNYVSSGVERNASLPLIYGTVDLEHPGLRGDIPLWRYGMPRWHVDRDFLSSREVLDRCWQTDLVDLGRISSDWNFIGSQNFDSNRSSAATFIKCKNLKPMNKSAHRYLLQRGEKAPKIEFKLGLKRDSDEVIVEAFTTTSLDNEVQGWKRLFQFRKTRICVGRAAFRTSTGSTPAMNDAIRVVFDSEYSRFGSESALAKVAPITFVYVDPRFRGFGFGRLLFLRCMRELANREIEYAVITVQDNGSGRLVPFYLNMGYKDVTKYVGSLEDTGVIMVARLNKTITE